jgi:hypothetical protein
MTCILANVETALAEDLARPSPSEPSGLKGLFGRPWVDLWPFLELDEATLARAHDEICLALAQLPPDYTGGSHRSMGIVPMNRPDDVGVDYCEIIAEMSDNDFATLRSLADDPASFPDRSSATFGEERDAPLSRRQMLWLKVRFGVYFPWKAYYELIPNRHWGDKATGAGKDFTRNAKAYFPKTIELVRSLPFSEVGRANIMGLESFDHGTVHRDGDPAEQTSPDMFITIVPGERKELFLWDDTAMREIDVTARAYWFNDFDYHGVRAAPGFRYSLRVDGVFETAFMNRLIEAFGGPP